MAFRSIVISLTAAITTIMSAFAGFGVLTLVVQEGGYRVRTLGTNVRNFFAGLVTGYSAARQVAPASRARITVPMRPGVESPSVTYTVRGSSGFTAMPRG